LWGHSDGAVIALKLGLRARDRPLALVGEATHHYRVKPASRGFFEAMMRDPDVLGARVAGVLAREHGEDYWRDLIRINGRAWLAIADEAKGPRDDLYEGRLGDLAVRTLLIHGRRDPRTEPRELDALRVSAPQIAIHIVETGGHSPHSEGGSADETTRVAEEFLDTVR
jgi:pimeloyl-ACP methyl ester carboxylesterase